MLLACKSISQYNSADNVLLTLSNVVFNVLHVFAVLLYMCVSCIIRDSRFGERGFFYSGLAAWNTLPSDLHDITENDSSVLFDRAYH